MRNVRMSQVGAMLVLAAALTIGRTTGEPRIGIPSPQVCLTTIPFSPCRWPTRG